MDVDSRVLRSFAVVAAEGNLTRAAEQLFITQPALTKQIRQLERSLGVELFVRSRAGMQLTASGAVLAERLPSLLRDLDSALRASQAAAARNERVLRIGFIASAANELTQRIIADFARRRPGWRVQMRQTDWSDPTAGLAEGLTDVAFVRLPFPGQDQLKVETLLTEPRWVALSPDHPLAHHDRLEFVDIWDEPFVATPVESGWWRDYWLAVDERQGHPVRIGAVAHNPDEWLNAIAAGAGISLTPEATSRYYQRPDVCYRPVEGVSPSQVGIAWSLADGTDKAVEDFIQAALSVRQKPLVTIPTVNSQPFTPAARAKPVQDALRDVDAPPGQQLDLEDEG